MYVAACVHDACVECSGKMCADFHCLLQPTWMLHRSLVNPSIRVVLPDTHILPAAGTPMSYAHADVAVRQGKWYYEIELTHWPDQNQGYRGGFGGSQASISVG